MNRGLEDIIYGEVFFYFVKLNIKEEHTRPPCKLIAKANFVAQLGRNAYIDDGASLYHKSPWNRWSVYPFLIAVENLEGLKVRLLP